MMIIDYHCCKCGKWLDRKEVLFCQKPPRNDFCDDCIQSIQSEWIGQNPIKIKRKK